VLQKPSRTLWIAAILVSLVCVGGLAYGVITDWNTPPDRTLASRPAQQSGSGFGLGLLVGVGAGVVLGSLIALRRKQ
jgi:hypothetical protein